MRETLPYRTEGSSALATSDAILSGSQIMQSIVQLEEVHDQSHTSGVIFSIEPALETVTTSDEQVILPPTTLDRELVKELLQHRSDLHVNERLAKILGHAWQASTIVERAVPSILFIRANKDPEAWYIEHASLVDRIIEIRTGLIDIYDETDPYVSESPFLRNALEIHNLAENRGKHDEGLRIEIAARMLVQEAIHAPQAE